MRFRILAHATFEAENIDDAFVKLSKHFQNLAEHGLDGESDLLDSGEITVARYREREPIGEEDVESV